MSTAARYLLVSLVLGVSSGLAASVTNAASSPYGRLGALVDPSWHPVLAFVSLLVGAGWAWAALPVVVGRRAASLRTSSVGGGAALLAATVSYYLLDAAVRDEPFAASDVWYWSLAGAVLGPPLGVVGVLSRRDDLVGVLAALVVPVGAALQMAVLAPGLGGAEPRPVAQVARCAVASAALVVGVLVLIRFQRALRRVDR